MKHFIVAMKRVAPELPVDGLEARTQKFLGEGFKKGILLMVGPSEDDFGLVFVARAASQAALAEYLETSPHWKSGLAHLDIVEFEPERVLDLMTGCALQERPCPAGDPDGDDWVFI